jgi:4-hydroxythreonine-4-phosphate dehydrogenase
MSAHLSNSPIAITQGDAAGIGPEIIVKAFLNQPELTRNALVVGSPEVMRRAVAAVAQKQPEASSLQVVAWGTESDRAKDGGGIHPGVLRVWPLQSEEQSPADGAVVPAWGQVSALAGRQAAAAVVQAAQAALAGRVSAVVTAPLHKEALHVAGVDFPGHTELLQAQAAQYLGCSVADVPVRMMLANAELRTVLVSIHVSLRQALDAVTFENVLQTLRISHISLSRLLGRAPRIAVAGLNPHAGEGGLFGREELEVIHPAVQQAVAESINALGPFPPDTVFMRARQTSDHQGEFDVVLAMYHDQGLIPVKYLGVDEGVNVTLGLPFVRTSPDHGTAFDKAGTGLASEFSLVQALKMAQKLSAKQDSSE